MILSTRKWLFDGATIVSGRLIKPILITSYYVQSNQFVSHKFSITTKVIKKEFKFGVLKILFTIYPVFLSLRINDISLSDFVYSYLTSEITLLLTVYISLTKIYEKR